MTTTFDQPTDQPAPRKARRSLPGWARLLAGALVGLGIGAAAGAGISLAASGSKIDRLDERLSSANERAREANTRADILETRASEASARAADLEQREAAVTAREEAVTVVEQQVAANSISEGVWTVGVDVEPGTYRVSEALTGYCYWAIYRSGTNGSDIVDNDGPTGGFPSVTLSAGQDFENDGCGTFVRQ